MAATVGCEMNGGSGGRAGSPTGMPPLRPPPVQVQASLTPYVASLAGYDQPARVEVHRGLPSTVVVVVLALHKPLEVGWWDARGDTSSYFAVASGLHTRPAAVGGSQPQRGIWLALTPAGSRALLGVPAAALADQILDLPAVAPHLGELPERLAEARCWPDRLRLVERVLLAALDRNLGGTVRREVTEAIPQLTGTATVEGAANHVGWSRRHLSTAFGTELGVTPKVYQRIARFEASRRRLTTPTRQGLAAVAAASGYADQAHLTREWTTLAGCPPAAWLRAEQPRTAGSHGRAN